MYEQFLQYIIQDPINHTDLCPLRIEPADAELHDCICPSEWFTGFIED